MTNAAGPKILFTKHYPSEFLSNKFNLPTTIDALDFIASELIDLELIKSQIQPDSQNFIITSQRAANHISLLGLTGNYFCVGETSAQILQQNPINKVQTYVDGQSLVEGIQKQHAQLKNQPFTYFCSSIRRDLIPDELRKLGHKIEEVITYKTTSQKVSIENNYDAYAFFSPSGAKSFQEQYDIPHKAVIFAIGETTADAVLEIFSRKALAPLSPDLESLTNLIKEYFDAKK